jgi:hypothetical protein
MVEGFKEFLTYHGERLGTVEKVRFKKEVSGDLEYSIFPDEPKDNTEIPHVL